MHCPMWTLRESEKCHSLPFSDTYLAKHVNADVFALHLASRMKITELKLVTEMEEQKKREVQAELKRLGAMDGRCKCVPFTLQCIFHSLFKV